jgi:hypothetical protein
MVCDNGQCTTCTTGTACNVSACQTGTTSCATGVSACTSNVTNVMNGTSCGTNMVCNSGSCVSCTTGATCNISACQTGTTSCTSGALSCSAPITNVTAGMTCGTNEVCDGNGNCIACTSGATCNPSACTQGTIACTTGAAVCGNVTNLKPGTSCGTNEVCDNGTCVACTAGGACSANGGCETGTYTCASGAQVCNLTTTLGNGASCGSGEVCDNGNCVSCTAGANCNPGGNTCQTGTTSCSSGTQTCGNVVDVTDGTACGTTGSNMYCSSGACVQWYTLTLVSKGGDGHLQTSDHKMMCASTWGNCSALYPSGASVTVIPMPEYWGYALSGGCSPAGSGQPCTITMTANTTINGEWETVPFVHWGSPAVTSGVTLSNNGDTATNGTNEEVVRATYSLDEGQFYWEMNVNTGSTGEVAGLGVIDSTASNDSYIGGSADGLGFGYGGAGDEFYTTFTGGTASAAWSSAAVVGAPPSPFNLATGDYYMFAYNASTDLLWIGKNGTWFNSGNPTAGTGATGTGIPNSIYPAAVLYSTGQGASEITLNWGGYTAFHVQPPWGF